MGTRSPTACAAAALALTALVGGCGGDENKQDDHGARPSKPAPPPELPRGGRKLFPDRRVVAVYGAPQTPALGILGVGSADEAARQAKRLARKYDRKRRRALPALELISTVASGAAGLRGKYNYRQTRRVVHRYLKAARKANGLLILDIQPGRARFIDEARRLRPFLEKPDVSLALDPEWAVGPGQIPGKTLGSIRAGDVNRVSRYLAEIVRRKNLPEKLLIIHTFTPDAVPDEVRKRIKHRAGVALVFNADGFGSPGAKVGTYERFARRRYGNGFKLFYEEDTQLMSPREVMALRPRPDVIVYE